jgi:hypothetical protein
MIIYVMPSVSVVRTRMIWLGGRRVPIILALAVITEKLSADNTIHQKPDR